MVTLYETTTDAEIIAVHSLPQGTIIKIRGQYERLTARLTVALPAGRTYIAITPGTDLYSQYGPDHLIAK